MDWSNIVVYAVIALAVLFLGPRVLNRGRGGNSPLNPPGRNPGGGSSGGGLFPGGGGGGVREEPKAPTNSPDTEGDFADRIEGDRPKKST